MLLQKTLSLSNVELKMDGETGRFAGYASVFNGVDSYGDTIQKGAFEESLSQHGMPKMFYNHNWDLPIGKYLVAQEDTHGLYVEGEFTPGMALSSEIRAAMKHGTVDGLSIGGYLKSGDYEETKTGRIIKRWSNLMEISPVVFPADAAARIETESVKADLKQAIEYIESIRDFEHFLRDAGNFSKGAAQALTARAKALFAARDAGDEGAEAKAWHEIESRLKNLAK